MDPSNYYITTFANAFKNLAPIALFLIGGYLVFIKLPFLFFLKTIKEDKNILHRDDGLKAFKPDYKHDDYLDFQRRMKIIGGTKEGPKSEKREQKKRPEAEKKQTLKKPISGQGTAEEVFDILPGTLFTKSELKKKYHELLKMNHPDKVASLGPDLKRLAEKKTKEINSAYTKLKSKAA